MIVQSKLPENNRGSTGLYTTDVTGAECESKETFNYCEAIFHILTMQSAPPVATCLKSEDLSMHKNISD